MPRALPRWPVVIAGLAVLAAILVTLPSERGVDGNAGWLAAVTLAGWCATLVVVVRKGPGRRRWWPLLGLLSLLIAALAGPLVVRQIDDEAWARRHERLVRERLDAEVAHTRMLTTALERFTVKTAGAIAPDSLAACDPFELCETWSRRWRALPDMAAGDSLAVALWSGDQRLGWAGRVVPGTPPPADRDRRLLHDDLWWVLGESAPVAGTGDVRLECQLRLAAAGDHDTARVIAEASVRRAVVHDARPPGQRSWGDAGRGLRLVEDVVLGAADSHGVRPRLRLSVQTPPRSLQVDRRLAAVALVRSLLLGLALLAWAAAAGGLPGFWLAAWLVRGFWAHADVVRWMAMALSAERLPASPAEPISLLDPAYFATTFAGGWLASGADALLTGLLAVGTAVWAWRRYQPPMIDDGGVRPRRRLLWLVPLVIAVVAGHWRLLTELTVNANARLIGLQIPIDAWTFWALHAVILMLSLAAGTLLVLAAARLHGGLPARMSGTARPFWLTGALLLVVLFNYFVLARAYGGAERDWIRRKAQQIVQPQDDWISFLAEDVLGEMATQDTVGDDPAEATGGRGSLRRDVPAFRLWSRSAMRDLGLPCLVEVLDEEGETASLYATGFLRDYAYEIVERSDWWSLAESGEEGGGRIGVMLQDEVRRYPTGQERILRGEIARERERGWLRIELPVQSLRIATLSRRLTGARDVRTGGGYRPRLEIDRPLLLLRGNAERWLDAGFGDLPAAAADRVIDDLRAGRREWADIDLDGRTWLCRWASLPPEFAATPGEGFLFGLQRRGAVEILLDLGRVLLLDVLLLAAWFAVRALVLRRWQWLPGFQGRFLLGYLAIGMVLLLVAGGLADRQTFRRIDREAREQTRAGLVTALGQLRGLLAEQARALVGSDYLAELLAGRLAGDRPLGPFPVRQGMVFGPDGELILDETLSDLDAREAAQLLTGAREGQLVVMQQPDELYLGILIPIDLGGLLDGPDTDGAFFYRQRIDDQMLPGLADVVGGELTLRLDGEVVDASHPGRVLGGENPLLASPELMDWFRRHPTHPRLQARSSGLAFTGGVALPAFSSDPDGVLTRRALPAVLSVDFPDRERDYAGQRRAMALFLAGLITLLLLTAFGLAMMLTWNIFEPLRVLLGATRQLAAGRFDAPLPASGGDEVGRLSAGFRTMRDQLHSARVELEARERFLRVVLDRVPVGVLVWTDAGRLAAWNPAAHEILARFYPDLPAGDDPADDRERWAARLRDQLSDLSPSGGGELRSQDGRRTLRVGRAPLELGGKEPHRLAVCEDLTEFLAAKKLALNAELARQVAHEIKNPLTPIQLSVQLLQQAYRDRHPKLDTIVEDAVERILEQVSLLRSIAGEFSLLGRPGDLECLPLELPGLVRDLLAGYRSGDLDGGPRVTVADVEVPTVLAHRESLLKVLGNLMQNSLDAAGTPDALAVDVTWRLEPSTVTLVWIDNGPGIDADVAGRLFDPYFSTKSMGTGLGLAICRNLLDKMGGTISLSNRTDASGAVARITLPRAAPGDDSPTD